jgi:hypothetical protein
MFVHGRPLVCRDDAFGRWLRISQSAVPSDHVVVTAPLPDQDLGLAPVLQDLTIQKLAPNHALKLSLSRFPKVPRRDESGFLASAPIPALVKLQPIEA